MTKRPTTLAQFRSHAVAGFKLANPDAVQTGLVIDWQWSKRMVWPTGLRGYAGQFTASAPGYAGSVVMADYSDETGLSVTPGRNLLREFVRRSKAA